MKSVEGINPCPAFLKGLINEKTADFRSEKTMFLLRESGFIVVKNVGWERMMLYSGIKAKSIIVTNRR